MKRVSLNPGALRDLLADPNGQVAQIIFQKSNAVALVAKTIAPRGPTGDLRRTIQATVAIERGVPVGTIGTNKEYAIYVHEGTGIHGPRNELIRPKVASVLRWPKTNPGKGRRRYKGGKTAEYVFSKYSKGQKGVPFLTMALERVLGIKVL
jgi:hypothetical protein